MAPSGKWLHVRLGLITVCGKQIADSWITVRQSPSPEQDEICPACWRREGFRALAPYFNSIESFAANAPESVPLAIAMQQRENNARQAERTPARSSIAPIDARPH